jgi:hypothetical protein
MFANDTSTATASAWMPKWKMSVSDHDSLILELAVFELLFLALAFCWHFCTPLSM